MKRIALAVAFLFAVPLFAQTTTTPPPIPAGLGYNVSINAGYNATTGNQTNNGFFDPSPFLSTPSRMRSERSTTQGFLYAATTSQLRRLRLTW